MSTAIEFNNISKQYRLGLVSTKTLSADLSRWWTMNVLHKEDPYLKIGSVNNRATSADSEFVWALRNIDFKVEQGDVVGIVGKNGAGKSTLLKLLSKVTAPTTGTIKAKGRIASLLEVGTGFHPEMTGRENIYLNGAILGMTKSEITRKLDEIVDFAGVERYIDTPTKRYSSGMTVRLGFAIAAHLDPEILVVDEVLAVGDAEFQKKAIGKMQEVSQGEGRTVLFVSHNMGSVRNLCKNGIVLKDGMIDYVGTANDAVDYYMQMDAYDDILSRTIDFTCRKPDMPLWVEFVSVEFADGRNSFASDEAIDFVFEVKGNKDVDATRINATVFGMDDIPIGGVSNTTFFSIRKGETKKIKFTLLQHHLAYGTYKVSFSVGSGNYISGQKDYDIIRDVLKFRIVAATINEVSGESVSQWKSSWGKIMIPSETVLL